MADTVPVGFVEGGLTPDGSRMQWPLLAGASANAIYASISDGPGIAHAIDAYEADQESGDADAAELIRKSIATAQLGNSVEADRIADNAISKLHVGQSRTRMLIYRQVGDRALRRGDLYVAIQAYSARLQICEPLVASTPSNAFWVQDLAFTHSGLGDVALLSGSFEAARASYESALGLMEKLSHFEPSMDLLHDDMALLYGKVLLIGDRQSGDRPAVLEMLDDLHNRGLLKGSTGVVLAAAREVLAASLAASPPSAEDGDTEEETATQQDP